MITTFVSAVLCSVTAGSGAYALYLADVYFFSLERRAPTGLDYLIIFALVLLPIIGVVIGIALGQTLRADGKSAAAFFTTPYLFIPIALVVFLGAIFLLRIDIAKRNATPAAQNTGFVSQLENTMWARQATDAQLQALSKSAPNQITKLSLAKTGDSSCAGGGAYTAQYSSGTQVKGCWGIAAGTNTLVLSSNDIVEYYQSVTLSSGMLSFVSAGQTWVFVEGTPN